MNDCLFIANSSIACARRAVKICRDRMLPGAAITLDNCTRQRHMQMETLTAYTGVSDALSSIGGASRSSKGCCPRCLGSETA